MKGRIRRPEGENNRLILPRIGSLKIGYKDEKTGFPKSVDYFIPVGKYAGLFTKAYGEKPNTVQIVFPDDDPAKVCNERYEYRDDEGRLIAYGDGEKFQCWDGKAYTELTIEQYPRLMAQIAEKYPNRQYKQDGNGWRVILTLLFIVPAVRGVAGLWQFNTKGSASTIPQIRAVFDGMLQKRGFCKGIVFDLSVEFSKSQQPDDARRYPVVSLVANESDENIERLKQIGK